MVRIFNGNCGSIIIHCRCIRNSVVVNVLEISHSRICSIATLKKVSN